MRRLIGFIGCQIIGGCLNSLRVAHQPLSLLKAFVELLAKLPIRVDGSQIEIANAFLELLYTLARSDDKKLVAIKNCALEMVPLAFALALDGPLIFNPPLISEAARQMVGKGPYLVIDGSRESLKLSFDIREGA